MEQSFHNMVISPFSALLFIGIAGSLQQNITCKTQLGLTERKLKQQLI